MQRENRRLKQIHTMQRLRKALKDQWVKRVVNGEDSGQVLAELNAKWCSQCDALKMNASYKQKLVEDIDELVEDTHAVARRVRTERIVWRVFTIMIIVLLGVCGGAVGYGVVHWING